MDEAGQGEMRKAGWMLAGSAVLSVILMVQHPSGADHGSVMTPIVHGGLQALMLAQMAALMLIVRCLGWSLMSVFAVVAFAAGQLAGAGAATINGFIVPAMGTYGAEAIGPEIFRFAWEANQALARMGAVAIGAAILSLAVVLWAQSARWLAVSGVAIGALTAFAIAGGVLAMDLHGAVAVYLSQWVWLGALGVVTARRELS